MHLRDHSSFEVPRWHICGYDSRSCRLQVSKESVINLVDFGKVGHIGKEDIDLDNIVEARTSSIQYCAKVLDALELCQSVSV